MPIKILAIDDSKTMRLAIKITFAAEDADVTSVSKGSDAVARATQMGAAVVLVDAVLAQGEPSGYDVCRQLKSDAATADTAVILMVSNQSGVDEARFKASGADVWIAKPFETQDLVEKVRRLTNQAGEAAAKPAAAKPAAAVAPVAPVAPVVAPPVAAKPPVRAPTPVAKPAVRAPAAPSPAAPRPAAATPVAATPAAATSAAAPRPAAAPSPATSAPMAPATPAVGANIPIVIPIPFTAADQATPGILKRLAQAGSGVAGSNGEGLDPKVVAALLSLSKEVIEQVVWEVVPDLAEEIIKKRAQSA